MAFTRLDGILLHHASDGRRDAPALVLSGSLGTDLRLWEPLLPVLAERFWVVRYDLRGHGLSDAPAGPYTIPALAQDLARLLDHLAVRGAVVCGLSIGGMIAQALAVARPNLVKALVLMATATKIGTRESWQQRIDAVQAGGLEAIAEPVLQRWFAPSFHARRPDDLTGYRHMLVRTPADGYVACCAAIRDADLTADAARIAQPTLCLAGADDGATPPELVRDLASRVPSAHFVLVEDAGHLPCVEQPAAVLRAMEDFIAAKELAARA